MGPFALVGANAANALPRPGMLSPAPGTNKAVVADQTDFGGDARAPQANIHRGLRDSGYARGDTKRRR